MLAQRVVNEDPDFYNRVARNVQTADQDGQETENSAGSNTNSNEQPGDKKDPGSA